MFNENQYPATPFLKDNLSCSYNLLWNCNMPEIPKWKYALLSISILGFGKTIGSKASLGGEALHCQLIFFLNILSQNYFRKLLILKMIFYFRVSYDTWVSAWRHLCKINFKKGPNITHLWVYKTAICIKKNLNKIKSFDFQRIKWFPYCDQHSKLTIVRKTNLFIKHM